MSDAKRVLCYGDSLTWGWVPVDPAQPAYRYSWERRWTGVMAIELGEKYEVIEEGLSGRTTDLNDPYDSRLNGAAYFPTALATHLPLDLVVIMLGTNDTKFHFQRMPLDIALGMARLVGQVAVCAGVVGTMYRPPAVLVVAPPPLGEMRHSWFAELFKDGRKKTVKLAHHYQMMAEFLRVFYTDAGSFVSTDGIDGVHFTEENNASLGIALAATVRRILA
ncbi:SGNH/GDSL hydrolase family protein [Streptomyces sp. NPDC019396]|uniref:SGNH/GDSL hydrolase family protein n=1 Tax=Streptomyces sp. NPDC019396 TaxID=3154687 RepID=UPI00340FEA3C